MSEPLAQSALLLRKQLAGMSHYFCYRFFILDLVRNPVDGFSAGLANDNDIYTWEIFIIGPPETLYEGGFFRALLEFPTDYPNKPPKMKFISEIFHPNSKSFWFDSVECVLVDPQGGVCISILHQPGEDSYGYERPEERWLPVHTVETILLSVISMISDPNFESPGLSDLLCLNYTFPKWLIRFSQRRSS